MAAPMRPGEPVTGSLQEETGELKAEAALLQEELEAIYKRLVQLGESQN